MIDLLNELEIDPLKTKGVTISNISRASTPAAQQETSMPPPPSPAVPAVSGDQKTTTPPPASTQPSVAHPQTPKAKFKTTTVIRVVAAAYDRILLSQRRLRVVMITGVLSVGMPNALVKLVISLAKERLLYIP
jgi:hypothetical protein